MDIANNVSYNSMYRNTCGKLYISYEYNKELSLFIYYYYYFLIELLIESHSF